MKLLADLHTHSKYSRFFHGKNKIEEMVNTANEMGLTEIAITDHGYKHLCGTNIFKLDKARDEVDEINKWSKTKVLLGVEADIISEDGTLDIDEDTLGLIDVLIVGYHKLIKTDFAGFFGGQKKTKQAIQKATNAYLNAIEKYPVTIVSHLDSILKTDLYAIGKACADKGVMVEINNRHTNWNEDQVNDLIASGCMFVVSSDAHRCEDIASVDKAFKLIKKYDIPKNLIANVEFDDIEKTEDDVEIEAYYGLYEAKQKAKQEQEELLSEKKKSEFTNSLSSEMEEKLRVIAQEQGISYNKPQESEEVDITEEYTKFKGVFTETEDIIRRAQDYLSSDTFNEFDIQNVKVQEDDAFIIDENNENSSSDEKEIVDETQEPYENHANVFFKEDEVIPAREFAKLSNQTKQEPEIMVEEVAKVVEPNEINLSEEISSKNEQVAEKQEEHNVLAALKVSSKAKPNTSSVKNGAVIVKNETSKKKVAEKPKPQTVQNGKSIQSFMQSLKDEDDKKVAEKPEKEEKRPVEKKSRGGFISIGGIDDSKK